MYNVLRTIAFIILLMAVAVAGAAYMIVPNSVRTGKARIEPPTAVLEAHLSIPAVPEKGSTADPLVYYTELRDYASCWVNYLGKTQSREEKLLRAYELLDALSQAMTESVDAAYIAELDTMLERQMNIITALAEPEKMVSKAMRAYYAGQLEEAICCLKLIVASPDILYPNAELVLAFWQAQKGNYEEAILRLGRVASLHGDNADFAEFLLAWCNLQQKEYSVARALLEDFQARHPASNHVVFAERLSLRLQPKK